MLFGFDQWRVDKFEKFSWWFQLRTGFDCFSLAKISAWAVVVIGILGTALGATGVVVGVLGVTVGIICLYLVRLAQAEYMRRVENMLGNKIRVDPTYIFLRNFVLFFFLFRLPYFAEIFVVNADSKVRVLTGLYSLVMVLVILTLHFIACSPLPPVKVKQWREARIREKEKRRVLKEAEGALPTPS